MYHNFLISNEEQMVNLGKQLQMAANQAAYPGSIIYLKGDLGAGKTTLVRGFVQALGHSNAVKSPTYTLVEPYEFDEVRVNHFDFYRIKDPMECEEMGVRDYFGPGNYCFVEWPEKGHGVLPKPDMMIEIETLEPSKRKVSIETLSEQGQLWLRQLVEIYE